MNLKMFRQLIKNSWLIAKFRLLLPQQQSELLVSAEMDNLFFFLFIFFLSAGMQHQWDERFSSKRNSILTCLLNTFTPPSPKMLVRVRLGEDHGNQKYLMGNISIYCSILPTFWGCGCWTIKTKEIVENENRRKVKQEYN